MKKSMVAAFIISMSLWGLTACGSTETTEENTTTPIENEAVDVVSTPDWSRYEELVSLIKSTTDLAQREAYMHEAEDILMDTGAIIPLYYYNDVYMQKEEITGIYTNNYGHKFFKYATGPSTTLRVNIASEPNKLDPALSSSVDGSILAKMSFSGLYSYDENGEIAPELAESYEVSEDGLVYTFVMKEDLSWSDGSSLDASDFEYSWKRAIAPETASDYGYMFDPIATDEDGVPMIVASEDGTSLTVTLHSPCAYFLDLVAFTTFLPVNQDAVEGAQGSETDPGAWALEAGFVSNGPFVLESWVHDESMVYVKNPNYHDANKVSMERIELMLSADDTAIYAAYQAGNLDFIDTIPTDEIANLLNDDEFYVVDQLGTYYASFNVQSPLFDGKTAQEASDMRKAFSLLIDREYIAEAIGQSGQQVATSFIPATMFDGNGGEFKANDKDYTYPLEEDLGYVPTTYSQDNVDQARALLEGAGFAFDGEGMLSQETPISIEYLVNEGTGHSAVGEAMQQDFAVLGIDMEIKSSEWNVFLDERKAGNYDFARNGWIADYNDPINMLEMWIAESGNNDCQLGR